MGTTFTFQEGATPRQIIDTLTKLCAAKPSLMDKPIIIDRPVIDAQEGGEFFSIGLVEVVGDQITFES